jgi:hypothetical protein
MSLFVKVASVLFHTKANRGEARAQETVLQETANVLSELEGYGLDLVVFSEGVAATGQGIGDAEALDSPGPFLNLYMDFAASQVCHVAGSVKLAENGRVYNSLAFIGPGGHSLGAYHKVNLTLDEIDIGLSSGREAVVIETPVWRLGGIICFDLNFSDLRDQYRRMRPDILAFASMYHGGLVQRVWAYECRSYFVSALPFIGGGILDPFGRPMKLTDCYTSAAMATINLDRAMVHLDYNRDKFPEIEKKYLGEIVVDIPPNVGSALILSLTEKRTAADVVEEFELELLDDYFQRALEANAQNRV